MDPAARSRGSRWHVPASTQRLRADCAHQRLYCISLVPAPSARGPVHARSHERPREQCTLPPTISCDVSYSSHMNLIGLRTFGLRPKNQVRRCKPQRGNTWWLLEFARRGDPGVAAGAARKPLAVRPTANSCTRACVHFGCSPYEHLQHLLHMNTCKQQRSRRLGIYGRLRAALVGQGACGVVEA